MSRPGAQHGALHHAAHRRSRRVCVLLVGIVILSIADLIITLANLRTVGMVEANPIAFHIITATHSTVSLTCYKLLTLVICITLLYRLRRSVPSEVASWACLVILAALALWWSQYSRHANLDLIAAIHQQGVVVDRWVTLAD